MMGRRCAIEARSARHVLPRRYNRLVCTAMSMRKLDAWRDAGLIDEATAQRIRAFEAEHARPLALWAALGIGALAIGLGIISVIAARSEEHTSDPVTNAHLVCRHLLEKKNKY